MTKHESIIETIRKLLAKANGTENEHEAAAFAAKAASLLAEHNISLAEVGEKPAANDMNVEYVHSGRSAPWRRQIGNAVAKLYFCDFFIVKTPSEKGSSAEQHAFIGAAHNRAVAVSMYVYLYKATERLARESAKRDGITEQKERWTYTTAFQTACAHRLVDRLLERYFAAREGQVKSETTGNTLPVLASLYDQAQEAAAKFLKDLGGKYSELPDRTRSSHAQGSRAGHRAGDEIGLDTQVTGGKAAGHLLASAG